ncbi:YciI family protein [Cryobacterium zhongshanensis]|uniref:YciI family protein n=1 Tax=Cryobacterium zhongshanensis TaxID=2928153 RepID=A0AA41UG00_9MICO|nr:YciI family protein [Cryobacterium zhongshanensis]MCI4656739.1 YciI family protein [Cryobacterium zhongshanensis]
MYAVSFYEVNAENFSRVREVYPRHRAYLDEFALGGEVVMIGTFADPAKDGSMAIFRSRAAAERFRADDPFVLEGLVGASRILDWDPLEFRAV